MSLDLSLSPNGKQLLFNYDEGSELPEDWKNNPTVRTLMQRGCRQCPIQLERVLARKLTRSPARVRRDVRGAALWTEPGKLEEVFNLIQFGQAAYSAPDGRERVWGNTGSA